MPSIESIMRRATGREIPPGIGAGACCPGCAAGGPCESLDGAAEAAREYMRIYGCSGYDCGARAEKRGGCPVIVVCKPPLSTCTVPRGVESGEDPAGFFMDFPVYYELSGQARAPHVGDMFSLGGHGFGGCPGVDVETWQAKNRIKVYPGQWNVWVLYRTLGDNASFDDIVKSGFSVMDQFFPSNEKYGTVDHVTVIPLWNYDKPPPEAATNLYDEAVEQKAVAHLTRAERREDLESPPMLKSGAWAKLLVKFVYRGSAKTMPWPAHTDQMYEPWCPTDADWIADVAYRPDTTLPVPAEPTFGQKVEDAAKKAKEYLTPDTSTVVAGLALAAGFVAIIAWGRR